MSSRRLSLVRGFVQGRPVWCSWQVTRRCESFCMFCDHRADSAAGELDIEGCRRVVGALNAMGSMVVSLTGGEPFLRADLGPLVGALAQRHFPHLTTHGWLVTPERAREVWGAGLRAVSVRLDHADAEAHDRRAGLKGAHARALQAVEHLVSERPSASHDVNVKCRLAGFDTGPVEGLLKLAAERGATVTVEPSYPLTSGNGNGIGVSARLRELARKHRNLRHSAYFLDRFDAAHDGGVGGCQAGRVFFNVDHRGRVSKCVEFQGPADRVGTMGEDDARTIAGGLRQAHTANDCRSCWYASRGEVEGLYTVGGLLRALPMMGRR